MKNKALIILANFMLILPMSCTQGEFEESEERSGVPVEADAESELPGDGVIPGDVGKDDEKMTFTDYCFDLEDAENPDPGLKATIDAVIKAANDDLCGAAATKASRMDPLDLSDSGITDLRPLRRLGGVANINLSGNRIEDVSILATMPSLTSIDLSRNPITSVESLSGLQKLRTLVVSSTRLEDFTSLENLSSLSTLYAESLAIVDTTPLGSLTSLRELSLASCDIKTLNGLENLSSLRDLNLSNSLVEDISVISSLTTINSLEASGTPVSEAATIENCPQDSLSAAVATFCQEATPAVVE